MSTNWTKIHNLLWVVSLLMFGFVWWFFLSRVGIPSGYERVNVVMILLIVAISYYFYWKNHRRTGLGILFMVGLTGIIIEYVAIQTCFPYGCFVYTDYLWYKLWNTVPWTVLVAWTPLVLAIHEWLKQYKLKKYVLYTVGALLLVLLDLVVDPWAVSIQFRIFEWSHPYYDVPWTNFLGWIITGYVGMWELHMREKKYNIASQKRKPEYLYTTLAMMAFWTSYAWREWMLIPFFIGIIISVILSFICWKKS
jgi:putative membrane protein